MYVALFFAVLRYEAAQEAEKLKSEKTLRPLREEIAELEKEVEDQLCRISSTKASIARNQEKIQNNLRLIATS